MAHYLSLEDNQLATTPIVLIVPGLNDSGPDHWQSLWQKQYADCYRVEVGMWDNPHRNTWVNKLNLAIYETRRPVILVAHSLGCVAVAWWAEYERPAFANPVVGALLVAPPDVDRPGTDPRLARFSSCPRQELPCPSFLIASSNDPYCNIRTAQSLAIDWGCRFADAGPVGHINAESGIGEWAHGQSLLLQLHREHASRTGIPFEAPLTKQALQAELSQKSGSGQTQRRGSAKSSLAPLQANLSREELAH